MNEGGTSPARPVGQLLFPLGKIIPLGKARRDPDAAPDSNFDGYNFWLAKLDSFGGDHRRAEMVKAFINSAEYRQRFGQQ